MAFAASLGVAAATSLISIFVLVALGGTNAYENLVIVSALTLLTTSATTYGITRRGPGIVVNENGAILLEDEQTSRLG
jgi:hypothetical protein